MRKEIQISLVVEDPPATPLLIASVMAGLKGQGIHVAVAEGLKDLRPELARVVEERNLAVAEAHRLRCRIEFAAQALADGGGS